MKRPSFPWSELSAGAAVYIALWQRAPAAFAPHEAVWVASFFLLIVWLAMLPRLVLRWNGERPRNHVHAVYGTAAAVFLACHARGNSLGPKTTVLALVSFLVLGALHTELLRPLQRGERVLRLALVLPTLALGYAMLSLRSVAVLSVWGLLESIAQRSSDRAAPSERSSARWCEAASVLGLWTQAVFVEDSALAAAFALGLLATGIAAKETLRGLSLVRSAQVLSWGVAAVLGVGALFLHAGIAGWWVLVAGVACVLLLVWGTMHAPNDWWSGRVQQAVEQIARKSAGAESVETLTSVVLTALREAVGQVRAPAELWVLEGTRRCSVEVSGGARVANLSLDAVAPLLSWLRTKRGELCFTQSVLAQSQRRPELKPIYELLASRGAYAAVPLLDAEELTGVLLLPETARTTLPEAQDEEALRSLSVVTSAALARVCALERAQKRSVEALQQAEEAKTALARIAEEHALRLASVRRPVRVAQTLRELWIGYAPSMRSLLGTLEAKAATWPLVFEAEHGSFVSSAALRAYEFSRCAGPCVFVDCSMVHPQDAIDALRAGTWWDDSKDGVLVLEHAEALTNDAKTLLEQRCDGKSALVLCVSRSLLEAGFSASIAEQLRPTTLRFPPLRERGEDLEALALLALDRGCRLAARAPVGIARDALAALRAWKWPGNEEELFATLFDAVVRVRSDRVTLAELPSALAGGTSAPAANETEAGSYEELERKMLEAALERANGNKSEAARALGLARTTFLDKLKRYGLRA